MTHYLLNSILTSLKKYINKPNKTPLPKDV